MAGRDVQRLSRLLERERQMLLRADVDGLATSVAEKTRLLERIAATAFDSADQAELAVLGKSARRNDSLYQAVMGGIAAARQRLEVLRAGTPAATYGARGQRTDIAPVRSSLHRRA